MVNQKLAMWEVALQDHLEAIKAVREAAQVEGPVLAVIK